MSAIVAERPSPGVVYGVLAVVWFRLVRHLSRQPLAPASEVADAAEPAPVY